VINKLSITGGKRLLVNEHGSNGRVMNAWLAGTLSKQRAPHRGMVACEEILITIQSV
jgi:hypothetical protein